MEIPAIPGRHLGLRLRRFRVLRGLKQQHVAELLDVSQGLISRWESGSHVPSPEIRPRIYRLIATSAGASTDRALCGLVEAANVPVHLICDATHRLLSASRPREIEWRTSAGAFLGQSLWRFATAAIVEAEERLADHGWFDRSSPAPLTVPTDGNGSREMRILPSILCWERIALADGRSGRLVTTMSFG
ncbi:hypothetical protein ASE90_09735 [Sphingomonas sp. Leaf67]|nr:hypothetical protein ASE90_09735 [Sphingomonas sp. Leaf67]